MVEEQLAEYNIQRPPQALGKELRPLKFWLLANNVSEENVKDLTLLVRVCHLDFMKFYSREYDSLPTVGVSGTEIVPNVPQLTLHIRFPDQVLLDPTERAPVYKQLSLLSPGYIQAFSRKDLLFNAELVEEIPTNNPNFIGILDDTSEEKAQFKHAINLIKEINDKYMPVFKASEELNQACNQLTHGLANKSIVEQKAIANQLAQLANQLQEAIESGERLSTS